MLCDGRYFSIKYQWEHYVIVCNMTCPMYSKLNISEKNYLNNMLLNACVKSDHFCSKMLIKFYKYKYIRSDELPYSFFLHNNNAVSSQPMLLFVLRVLKTVSHWGPITWMLNDNVQCPTFYLLLILNPQFNTFHPISTCCIGCCLSNLPVGCIMRQICNSILFTLCNYNLHYIDSKYTLIYIIENNH